LTGTPPRAASAAPPEVDDALREGLFVDERRVPYPLDQPGLRAGDSAADNTQLFLASERLPHARVQRVRE